MRVYLAGASGVIGRRLVPQLIERGHSVFATTRGSAKAPQLQAMGAQAVVVDGLDAAAVGEAVARAEPDIVVHQMTALAGKPDLRRFDRWFATTNKLRTQGTEILLSAAQAAGVERVIAQSFIGWNNARSGDLVKSEEDPLDARPAKWQRESMAAIRYLEEMVPAAPLEGIVLRYGSLYGPGASDDMIELVRARKFPLVGDGAGVWSFIHVDDAAAATVAALEQGGNGVFNVVDDDPAPVAEWLPYLADAVGAKPPQRVPAWLGRLAAGEVPVRWMTQGRGASNARFKATFDWQPIWPSWRKGFREGLSEPSASRPPARAA
jgi:nucleoside-diphosphate-sugar epimerase